MVPTLGYKKIVEHAKKRLKSQPISLVMFDGVDAVSRNAMAEINSKTKKHRMIGLLFCNPSSTFCRDELLPFLNYFHYRSEDAIDFYCAGYGDKWQPKDYADKRIVTNVAENEWQFSDIALIDVIKEFEEKTTWKYSGECELLLLDVSPCAGDDLDINNAIICNLELMHKDKDKAFTSLRGFVEELVRYVNSDKNADAWKFSDRQGGRVTKEFLKDAVLGLLPKQVETFYRKAEPLAVKNITKQSR